MKVTVRRCQRCGKNHQMVFAKLTNPADEWTHWGLCPNTKEPVLLRNNKTPIGSVKK